MVEIKVSYSLLRGMGYSSINSSLTLISLYTFIPLLFTVISYIYQLVDRMVGIKGWILYRIDTFIRLIKRASMSSDTFHIMFK